MEGGIENEASMLSRAVARLLERVSDLAVQLEALQRVVERHGIPAAEIGRAVEERRVEVRGKRDRDVKAATEAALTGDWRRPAGNDRVQ